MDKKIALLIIDPQTDFCDAQTGSLYVPGAENDSERLAALLDRVGAGFDSIHVTMDAHYRDDIGHPLFWVDAQGNHPEVDIPAGKFPVVLSEEDLLEGRWTPADPEMRAWALEYVHTLASGNRYAPVIWPYHCLIGEPGGTIYAPVAAAVARWELTTGKRAHKVLKGMNRRTEHYSAVKAEVADPADPHTMVNRELIEALSAADEIAVSGQALSHCVANTVRDIADALGADQVSKLVLLEDTASNVPTFEALGEAFVGEMSARGMRLGKSVDYCA
ncbi:hypothetical protein [Magnetofaba australis]|uniref:Isochorismatase hydrolase n=1 Tax=Magnetofaba australis IT-1 TaxID=1434232 RepID=A0A1Y2K3G3_9PROT|nr:hypothetical protein [Magnetofaba australis]OSM01565.1 hypothetical protein MAIT1_01561 [Magnetofaba australis IT-1]